MYFPFTVGKHNLSPSATDRLSVLCIAAAINWTVPVTSMPQITPIISPFTCTILWLLNSQNVIFFSPRRFTPLTPFKVCMVFLGLQDRSVYRLKFSVQLCLGIQLFPSCSFPFPFCVEEIQLHPHRTGRMLRESSVVFHTSSYFLACK